MNQRPRSEDTGAAPPHRESPSWGSSDTVHCWVGIGEGRGPSVLTAQREGFRSPCLTCSGLRPTLLDSVTLEGIKTSKG